MATQTKWIVGFLILAVLSTSIYIMLPNNVRLDVGKTSTTFKVWEDKWVTSATEYIDIYSGTSKLAITNYSLTKEISGTNAKIIRTRTLTGGIKVIDTYSFDGSTADEELFPIYHTIQIEGAKDKILQFKVSGLYDNGPSRDAISPSSFGKNMKITWQSGDYFHKIVYSKTTKKSTLTVKYKITSNNQIFNVRVFDPLPEPNFYIKSSNPSWKLIKDDSNIQSTMTKSALVVTSINYTTTKCEAECKLKFASKEKSICGNLICESDETSKICAKDCTEKCGDKICDKDEEKTCPKDCTVKEEWEKCLDACKIGSPPIIVDNKQQVYSDVYILENNSMIKVGFDSDVYSYENNTEIVYIKDDYNITATLKKFNGISYVNSPDDIFINSTIFGGIDFSPLNSTEGSLNKYQYFFNSTKTIKNNSQGYYIEGVYSNLKQVNQFFGYTTRDDIYIDTHDICTPAYSNCVYSLENNNKILNINFYAKVIDGKVTIDPYYKSNITTNVQVPYSSYNISGTWRGAILSGEGGAANYTYRQGLYYSGVMYNSTYKPFWEINISLRNDQTNNTYDICNADATCLAYYTFDDFKGTSQFNDKKNSYHGTWQGSQANYSGPNSPTLYFDSDSVGDTRYLKGNTTLASLINNGFTYSLWWYTPNVAGIGGGVGVARFVETGGSADVFNLVANGNGKLQAAMLTSTGHNSLLVAVDPLVNNQWQYLTFTWNGSTKAESMKLYVNGVLANYTATDYSGGYDSIPIYSTLQVGGSTNVGGGATIPNLADEAVFFNRSITADEVYALYNAGIAERLTGSNISLQARTGYKYNLTDTSLIGLWGFNDITGKVTDELGKHNGTTHGDMFNSTEGNGTVGPGYYFDGSDDFISVSLAGVVSSCLWLKPTNWEFACYNGSDYFKNGVLASPTSYPLNYSNDVIQIGINVADSSFFTGSIDEVRVYNRSLSADEILDLYQNSGINWNSWTDETYTNVPILIKPEASGNFAQFRAYYKSGNSFNSPLITSYDFMMNMTDKLNTSGYNIYPANDSIIDHNPINYTANATDDFNLSEAQLFIDGIKVNTTSITGKEATVGIEQFSTEGTHSYYYRIINVVDNYFDTTPFYYLIDSVAPWINILYPINGANYLTNVTEINYTVSDSYLDSCWFSDDEGTTNTSFSCTDGSTSCDMFSNNLTICDVYNTSGCSRNFSCSGTIEDCSTHDTNETACDEYLACDFETGLGCSGNKGDCSVENGHYDACNAYPGCYMDMMSGSCYNDPGPSGCGLYNNTYECYNFGACSYNDGTGECSDASCANVPGWQGESACINGAPSGGCSYYAGDCTYNWFGSECSDAHTESTCNNWQPGDTCSWDPDSCSNVFTNCSDALNQTYCSGFGGTCSGLDYCGGNLSIFASHQDMDPYNQIGLNTWRIYANDTFNHVTFAEVNFTLSGADDVYPIFSDYGDNNGTLTTSGTGLFNVTVENTNGTVWLEINNTNITATNLTSNVYNVSYDFTSNGTYIYRWHAYGNGTDHNYNVSIDREYFIAGYSYDITECRNLTLNGTYTLLNNISGYCLQVLNDNITINGGSYKVTGLINATAIGRNAYTDLVLNNIIVDGTVIADGELYDTPATFGYNGGSINISDSTITQVSVLGGASGGIKGGTGGTVIVTNSSITVIDSSGGRGYGGVAGDGGYGGTVSITNSNTPNITTTGGWGGVGKGGSGGIVTITNSNFGNITAFGGEGNTYYSFASDGGNGGNVTAINSNANLTGLTINLLGGIGHWASNGLNGTLILNQTSLQNSFGGIKFSYVDSTETGINSILEISDNNAYVDSSNYIDYNVSANITLTGIPTFTTPVMIRDGIRLCDETTIPSCYNFTDLNAGTVIFNVSSWTNYSIEEKDITAPVINLVSPSNNSFTNTITSFVCNITDATSVENITLFIWNSTNDIVYENTKIISGTSNQSSWNYNLSIEDIYQWNCFGYDTVGNSGWGVLGNYTITYDITPPVVAYELPNMTEGTYNQEYIYSNSTASDTYLSSIIFNLYYGGALVNTATSSSSPYFNNFTGLTTPGTYTLELMANDSAGNYGYAGNRTYELLFAAPNGTVWVSGVNVADSLWIIEFGKIGAGVPVYNSTKCGPVPSGIVSYENTFKNATRAISLSSQSTSTGIYERNRFGIVSWPRRFYSNTYRMFYEVNETLSSGNLYQFNINISSALATSGINKANINTSTYRLYRVNRQGYVYNDTQKCYEQPISMG